MELFNNPESAPLDAHDDPNLLPKELFKLKQALQEVAAFAINYVDHAVLVKVEAMLQEITTHIEKRLENYEIERINTRHVMWLLEYTIKVASETAAEFKRLGNKSSKSCSKKDKLNYGLRIKKHMFVFVGPCLQSSMC